MGTLHFGNRTISRALERLLVLRTRIAAGVPFVGGLTAGGGQIKALQGDTRDLTVDGKGRKAKTEN